MIDRKRIQNIVSEYDKDEVTIGVLGSHSALEIGHGAKQEGFETLVVCQEGRERTYTEHYSNLFDEVLLLDDFSDMVEEENQERMRELNTIFVPNRSFSVYVGYDNIENRLEVPLLGSRNLLRTEERDLEKNQYYLLDEAGINKPKIFDSPEEIDRPAIIKVPEKDRKIERAFFYASSYEEYKKRAEKRIDKGIIDKKDLEEATIEEYILGAKFNANYFWSPIKQEIDLLGFDRRIQTDYEGVTDLPADEQLEIGISPQNVEIGHMGATMRESQIEMIFEEGEKFVETSEEVYPPGIIGLFALQGAVTKDLEFYVFDVSPRIPGCPCVEPTSPYTKYKYMKEVGPGRRVAMEIKEASEKEEIQELVT
ncbi:MAG: 5-formaminoimidazole-4-carboxamide-1-beta-D-ribofuranosyl 5'-monophosphate synthetase [Candidatus Methanohalarchaeum thermophilum]|uniref:5-formaminoimidazole-4-carboxamide-1-beta-D-ribofuranosyl 5'-monophosphate synthetase n=1 Tax=Methanohalarchaeum thermophilum TaxID=1903181 RepID=A0A1Q6DXU4_METT1|nr:MAG: 5-formaminoimidazole-4-carboxamide-1-beta-D-ribofuranosyl 5'-monophosphate synthetase [Candidatus Methanohalarchaeum thermophilum]